jgi:uncharacterized protein YkwD
MSPRFWRGAAAAVASAVLLGTGPAAAQADTACAGAEVAPTTTGSIATAQRATLCLLNVQRAAHHLRPLRAQGQLRLAATRYSTLMVADGFFSHVSPTGSTTVQRIEAAGYRDWTRYAENLGWGYGSGATPAELVAGWMQSSVHRKHVLDGKLREIGIGIVVGAPFPVDPGTDAATYTAEFGTR